MRGQLLGTLSLCLMVAFSPSWAASPDGCEQEKCVIMIDAGSTGSRLHVYSYDLDEHNSPINITERFNKKTTPGIASLDAKEAIINTYLDTLFTGAPTKPWPVYVYATAGMRLLSKPKQDMTHALVRNWFAKQSNWQLMSSRTITGSDEGVYGWLAVNYQLGAFSQSNKEQSSLGLVGVMDMGGASVQIAFPVKDTQGIEDRNLRTVTLNGRPQKLFVKSFLGLGQTEVMHQYLASRACFAQGYETTTGEAAAGDAYTCAQEVNSMVTAVHEVNRSVPEAIYRNNISKWYALGGLNYLVKSQAFNFADNQFTAEALLNKGQSEVCQQPWDVVSAKYPNDDFLYGYCLFPAYYYSLMINGYGIRPEETIQVLDAKQTPDWTIGAVLAN